MPSPTVHLTLPIFRLRPEPNVRNLRSGRIVTWERPPNLRLRDAALYHRPRHAKLVQHTLCNTSCIWHPSSLPVSVPTRAIIQGHRQLMDLLCIAERNWERSLSITSLDIYGVSPLEREDIVKMFQDAMYDRRALRNTYLLRFHN